MCVCVWGGGGGGGVYANVIMAANALCIHSHIRNAAQVMIIIISFLIRACSYF